MFFAKHVKLHQLSLDIPWQLLFHYSITFVFLVWLYHIFIFNIKILTINFYSKKKKKYTEYKIQYKTMVKSHETFDIIVF